MATTVILPQMGETMDEGTIVEWMVQEGDAVERGDILFQVESDKAVLEVESRQKGVLRKILVGPDVPIPVLTPVAIIGEPDEDLGPILAELEGGGVTPAVDEVGFAQSAVSEAEPEATITREREREEQPLAEGRVIASPRARKRASEAGVDLRRVAGTGPGGRIIEEDVLAYLAEQPKATPLATRTAEREGVSLAGLSGSGARIREADVRGARAAVAPEAAVAAGAAPAQGEVQPMRGVRAIIAERMSASSQTTAAITLQTEVDATALVALREQLRDALADELGFNVGYNDLLGVIVSRCLVEYPYMNVQLTEQGIRHMPAVNLGLAVDSERGLLVPVVRNAERLTVKGFALAFRDLVQRARQGRCQPDELAGGTFTITNMGMFGVDMFTPIINLPECAILGVGRIRPVPAVVDGEVAVRQIMWLSLTADHRLVDGAPAARFLQGISRYIEAPYLLLT
jgi:pyruvate dehydrogenase E2 component (dihydrolipoamide acetyltransferase)